MERVEAVTSKVQREEFFYVTAKNHVLFFVN